MPAASAVPAGAWFSRATLGDVELAREASGALVASRVLGEPLARVCVKDLRAICGVLGVGGCSGKRKIDMARMIAAKKVERAGPQGGDWQDVRSVTYAGSRVTVADKLNQLYREFPDVMASTAVEDLLPHGAPSRLQTSTVAALYRRPPRVVVPSLATPVLQESCPVAAPTVGSGSANVVDERAFGAEADDENCSNTRPPDDIHFVTPQSQRTPSPKKTTPVKPEPPTPTILVSPQVVTIDDDPTLDKWFKVSERISELRQKLNCEDNQEMADELKDDIAFLVRKKRRLTRMM